MNEEYIITIEHLSKFFSGKQFVKAVNDVSFQVGKGEIFGLLGPNGAGKSTIIRILTTLLKPTTGQAWVHSYDVTLHPEKVRQIIGVCPQNSTLDLELSAYDNLDFYGKLTDVPEDILPSRIYDLLSMVGLADRAKMQVSTFSGGMKRKLEIVRAFIHKPLILFLDEPTIGLDPESRREVWNQITSLNNEETTIILTTHYMDEAEKLCDRIAIVDNGSLIALDTPENLKQSLSTVDIIEIGINNADNQFITRLSELPFIDSVEKKGQKILISTRQGTKILPPLLYKFEEERVTMTSIVIRSPSLEDVFISLTGRNLGSETVEGRESRGRHS